MEDSASSRNIFFTLLEHVTDAGSPVFMLLKFVPSITLDSSKVYSYFNLQDFSGTIYTYNQFAEEEYAIGVTDGRVQDFTGVGNEAQLHTSGARVQIALPPPDPCSNVNKPCGDGDGGGGGGLGGRMVSVTYREYTDWYQITTVGNSSYVQYLGSDYVHKTRYVWVSGDTSPSPGSTPQDGAVSHEHISKGNAGHPATSPHPKEYLKLKAELWEEEICEKANFTNNPCVKAIWEEMKALNVGYETLKRFTGQNPVAGLCIDIQDLGSDTNGNAGQTSTKAITININSQKLNRSKLSIARTILHEMIHAELTSMVIEAGGGTALQNYAETYEGKDDFMMIWTYYEKYKPYVKNVNPGWQHELMADYYIEYIAEGLKKLHPSLGSQKFINYWERSSFNLEGYNEMVSWSWEDFYIGLEWEGLKSTEKWNTMEPKRKQLFKQYFEYGNYESNKCN
ncbi:MAG: hypothetical protein HC819_19365 [Cyclobacteriaceae bacterium]|nr:hypothetical protein [Cyclobacteriaceae bacterium]